MRGAPEGLRDGATCPRKHSSLAARPGVKPRLKLAIPPPPAPPRPLASTLVSLLKEEMVDRGLVSVVLRGLEVLVGCPPPSFVMLHLRYIGRVTLRTQ